MKEKNLQTLKESKIVAIIRGIDSSKIIPVVTAFKNGGIKCIEVTFNTPNAAQMISDINNTFKDEILVGAGTVTDEATAKIAYEAGAKFILSPSLHKDVIDFCKSKDIISVPGAYTPTEIVMAQKYGADVVKLFPVASMDATYIKNVKGPINNVNFMGVGGVNLENANEFIERGCNSVGIGSSLVNKELIANDEYDKLTELAKKFVEAVQG